MPSTVKEWMWWVSLIGTVLLIATFAFGAFSLRKSGCLGQVTKSMWIPTVLFVSIQLITLMVTKFAGEDPVVTVEEEEKQAVVVPVPREVISVPPPVVEEGDDSE